MLRLIRWALWLPTWQPAYSAPCHPDAGDPLQAPSTHHGHENRAGLDRVWIGVTEKTIGKRWYDGTPPAHVEAFRPTGRRNRPLSGVRPAGNEAGPLATRACVNRVARAHRPDGKSQQLEGNAMSNVTNMRDFKNRRDRRELGLDDHRRETRRFSFMATRVTRRRPAHSDGDDLPPAA